MRPVNQLPLSLIAMKRSPLASSRRPDNPPKPRNREVRISPLRYSSSPNRRRDRSRVSNEGSGRALTSIETGAMTENSSGTVGFGGRWTAVCAAAMAGMAVIESAAAAYFNSWRRAMGGRMRSRVQTARPVMARGGRGAVGLAEQFGEFFGNGAAEFLGIDDGDGTAIVARDVVTDADRDQFDRRTGLDLLDDVAQVPLEIIAGIHRQRGIVDRRAVRNHHQDLALLGPAEQPLVRPVQRLAVDILLQESLAHHQPEILARAPPRRIGGFVDDVPQIVQPAGIGRLAGGKPRLARLPALPGSRGEAENLDLDAAALQRARENIGAGRRHRNRAAAHRAGIVQQQRYDRIAEGRFLLMHEGQRMIGIGDHARQPRRIEDALLEIELPGAG